jgi:hypothetical protein
LVTELGGAQISSLLETLPGIAQVLRSPVADAFVVLIRHASRHADFQVGAAEEVLRFSVRRNLMSQDESDRILAELREGIQRRAERAADRAEARKPGAVKPAVAKPVLSKPVAKPVIKVAPKPVARVAPVKPAVREPPKPRAKAKPAKPAPKAKAKPARPVARKKVPARKK